MENKLFDLTGKTAIVTGGAKNLGQYMAKGLNEYGANVVLVDIDDDFEESLSMLDKDSMAFKVDITEDSEVKNMVKRVEKEFGGIDILVNNAAICPFQDTFNIEPIEFLKVFDVNVLGVFLCCRAVFSGMKKRGYGKIINIASVYGMVGVNKSIYTDDVEDQSDVYSFTSSKAAVINLTRDLAVHWGRFNINVNAISPGMMMTKIIQEKIDNEDYDKNIISRMETKIPMGRLADPSELIGGIVYLASNASSYVNGHNLVIDGGWVVW